MPREVAWPRMAGHGLADLAREGINQISLWVPLVWLLPTNKIPAPVAHMLYDSQCTFFLPVFISTPSVALPLKPYGSPLHKCSQEETFLGQTACVWSLWAKAGSLVHSSLYLKWFWGLFGPEWIRLWLKFSGEHDLYLHNRYKVCTVSIWCLEYLTEFKSFIEPAFTKCRVPITEGLSFCDLFMICQGLTRSLSYYQMSVCSLENSVKVAYNVHQTHPSHWQA